MGSSQPAGQNWKRSSRCHATNACVEVKMTQDEVALRDSKDPETVLHFTHGEMDAFLYGAKCGEFDRPATSPDC